MLQCLGVSPETRKEGGPEGNFQPNVPREAHERVQQGFVDGGSD